MTIYEVRIEVDQDIAKKYRLWLKKHIREVAEAAGFERAHLFSEASPSEGVTSWTVHYWASTEQKVQDYLEKLAPAFRADGVRQFGDRYRAQRRILNFQEGIENLTSSRCGTQSSATSRKDSFMTTQVNWQKIRNEFQRLTDVEELKAEVKRIRKELRKFDFQAVLSPAAKTKVKAFEKRYAELMRTIQQAQRQVDREVNRIMRQIKGHRKDVSKIMTEQKDKLEDLSKDFRKRFSASKSAAAKTARNPSSKRVAKKTRSSKKRGK